ncbi:MAG: cytochrome c biogenesis protein ResB [Desulfobacula sp.]
MKNNKTIPEQIWQFFCSAQLAVYTLVILAFTSIIGTVILQNGTEQEYIEFYGHGWYNLIKTFNFDDMYHSWWFLGLIVILCVNIIVCSIERLQSTWKIIFPKKITFNPDRFKKLKNRETVIIEKKPSDLIFDAEKYLSKLIGPVLKEDTETAIILYAEKGRWTRLGVYVVHTSLLLLFSGALIGSLFGFKANLNLDEGKSADSVILMENKNPVKLGFSIRCNDFNVKFYDTGAPEEFKSNLTLIEDGKEILTQDILVNHPLRYKGINIFQSSYGSATPDSVSLEIVGQHEQTAMVKIVKVGEEIQLSDELTLFKLEGFLPHFEFNGNDLGSAFIGRIVEKDGKSFQIGLPLKFPTFDKMRKGSFSFVIKGVEQKYYTGLHITKDPGLWYVYAGFILMIIGCWVTFFMAHESYLFEIETTEGQSSNLSISGTSNRNSHGLKFKIRKMCQTIKG